MRRTAKTMRNRVWRGARAMTRILTAGREGLLTVHVDRVAGLLLAEIRVVEDLCEYFLPRYVVHRNGHRAGDVVIGHDLDLRQFREGAENIAKVGVFQIERDVFVAGQGTAGSCRGHSRGLPFAGWQGARNAGADRGGCT